MERVLTAYKEKNQQLWHLYKQFQANSYLIDWRDRVAAVEFTPDPTVGRLLFALSTVETDTASVYQRLCAAHAYRRPPMHAFAQVWLREELEHGQALRALACRFGVTKMDIGRQYRTNIRSIVSTPALRAARVLSPGVEAVYVSVGTITEYVALSIYRRCSFTVSDPAAQSLFREIAAQEGRHMRFYRNAAVTLIDNPSLEYLTRFGVRKFWRPPGVDPLGIDAWLHAFNPLLKDEILVRDLLRADSIAQSLPGLNGLHVMREFLSSHSVKIPDEKIVK